MGTPSPRPAPVDPTRRRRSALALLLVAALALRLGDAALGSLHLDDFHTLFHARAADLGAFFSSLRADNHPPLSFLLVRAARALLGEGALVLSQPALLAGLLAVPLAWRLGERVPERAGAPLSAALVAFSSLHVELSSDLRMYALLALAVAGLLEALVALSADGRGAWRAAAWTVVGFHTHYQFVHAALLLVGLSVLLLVRDGSRGRAVLRAAAGPAAAAALACAPWALWGLRAQLAHDLPPGGSSVSLPRLAEAQVHLLLANVRLAGVLRPAVLAAGAASIPLGLLGCLRLLRDPRPGVRALGAFLAAGAFLLPVWSAGVARVLPRSGFEWRYLAGSIVPFAVAVAAAWGGTGWLGGVRRGGVALVALAALALSLRQIPDPGSEDYAGGARAILARAGPDDFVVAAEWQPRIFPHGMGWEYYLGRSGLEHPPRPLEHDDDFRLAPGEPWRATGGRVFVLSRSLPGDAPLLRTLRAAFADEEARTYGGGVWVSVFSRPVAGGPTGG